jgi:MHS family proline/betaine transporter-like MFS transporter
MELSKIQLWGICLGNLFKYYDLALFSLLSPYLAPLFFPNQDPTYALIFTFCLIPLGSLASPFGSLFFGHIGDSYGRKKALIFSFLGMAIASFAIALTPTWEQGGILGWVWIGFARIIQSFCSSGETMGGGLLLLEQNKEDKRDFLSGVYSGSSMAGVFLASLSVSLLYSFDAVDRGWRPLYLIGTFTAVMGLVLRGQIAEEKFPKKPFFSLRQLFVTIWKYKAPFILLVVTSGFSYACYYVSLVLLNGLVPLVTTVTKAEMMRLNTGLLFFDMLISPLFGLIASRYSAQRLMMISTSVAAALGIPLLGAFDGASYGWIVCLRLLLVTVGVAFSATYHSWSLTLIPYQHRYTLLSFSHSVGSQLLGAPTAALSLWLFHATGSVAFAGAYWAMLGFLSFGCLWGRVYLKQPQNA